MTGEELLIQRMVEKYNMTQRAAELAVQTKSVQHVIEIFSEDYGLMEKAALESLQQRERVADEKLSKAQEESKRALNAQAQERANKQFALASEKRAQELRDEAKAAERRTCEMMEEFKKIETPEARDALRKLQLFKSMVNLETPQNNTAYITGVAAILSGQQVRFGDIDVNKLVGQIASDNTDSKEQDDRKNNSVFRVRRSERLGTE